MSEEKTTSSQPDWRARMQEVGKSEFIREEMERLGYWPPEAGVEEAAQNAEAKLQALYAELRPLQSELREIDKELRLNGNVAQLLLEVRKKRIERVRAARDVRRAEKQEQTIRRREADKIRRQTTLPYLGAGVSAGLHYEGSDTEQLERLGLPLLNTAAELADAIGISTRELGWLTYHRGASTVDHYSRFTIPKRSGGLRVISSPKRQLRTAHAWILTTLLNHIAVHDAAMAFRPGRSILDNAKQHTGKAVVVRMDLKDFFPSIRARRVRGLFESFGYNEGIASLLALLTTECPRVAATLDGEKRFVALGARSLPQGACTSPALTNILCRRLDARLTGLAAAFGFTYSRYADDLVFSHSQSEAPVGPLLGLVRTIIMTEGYVINEEKTRVMRPQHRQAVTGVVVNETPRVSRHDIRRFRAFLHHCETDGFAAVSERLGKNALLYAAGYLSFLHMVNPEQARHFQDRHPWLSRFGQS
ncbi:MAG: RNA-dependent polymerase [Chthonomonadaceae bacterium]|nr:RNA-dependent polymerase [Chthonomonadaceae bacterium]